MFCSNGISHATEEQRERVAQENEFSAGRIIVAPQTTLAAAPTSETTHRLGRHLVQK